MVSSVVVRFDLPYLLTMLPPEYGPRLPGSMPLMVRVHDNSGNVQSTLRRDWDGIIRRS